MAARAKSKPQIKEVWAVSGPQAGTQIKDAAGGTVIFLYGQNLEAELDSIQILLDDYHIGPPLQAYASDSSLGFQIPIIEHETKNLLVIINGTPTNNKKLATFSQYDAKAPGGEIIKLYGMIDAYCHLLSGTMRQYPFAKERVVLANVAADYMDGARAGARLMLNTLMEWQGFQKGVVENPIRTLEFADNLISGSNLVKNVSDFSLLFISNMTSVPLIDPIGLGQKIKDLIKGSDQIIVDALKKASEYLIFISEIIHESSKVTEGIEHFLKISTPSYSLDGGGSAGGELTIGVDVSFSMGEAFSGLAKGIDAYGQIFGQDAGPSMTERIIEISQGIQKLELKADEQAGVITIIKEDVAKQEVKADKVNELINRVIEDLGKIETKGDRQEEKLDILETKLDRQEEKLDRQEEKLDILETKSDRAELKLDRQEEKLDRQEEKLDVLEIKADRAEAKLDKQEEKLDKIEMKADRAEQKLDRLEQKNDKQEKKLDKLETKADRAEKKLDLQERKLDKLESKADRAERKLDRQERKLDKLETKADRQEKKLDKIEAKQDKVSWPVPNAEGSIANQRGGHDDVTAAVATIKARDGKAYIRFAVDVERDQLDEAGSFTAWKNFDKPSGVLRLAEISIDLQYEDQSNTIINGLLIAQDALGKVYSRTFERGSHSQVATPGRWTPWSDFLGQP